jgi:hypothetical protein
MTPHCSSCLELGFLFLVAESFLVDTPLFIGKTGLPRVAQLVT